MAQQYRDAVEALEDPELREKYEEERRTFMRELFDEVKKSPTRAVVHIPVERSK